jgi:hypothetical protein
MTRRKAWHIGEADGRHRFGAAASTAMRARRGSAEQGSEQRNRAYFQHVSLLLANAKGRLIGANMVKLIFGDYGGAINGAIVGHGRRA